LTELETRMAGKTKDCGWQAGMRRTLPIQMKDAWQLLTSKEGVAIWLGGGAEVEFKKGTCYQLSDGTSGEIRVVRPCSHLRLTWQPPDWLRPSTMQLRLVPSGSRTVLALHQEHLPGPETRHQRLLFFKMYWMR